MFKTFLSMGWAIFLMFIFAFAIAAATIIEQNSGTTAAWLYVYGTHWLEIIMALLAIALAINLFNFKLFCLAKIPVLVFHFSFILIALGAFITRYFGFEGSLHLRINEAKDSIFLEKYYLKICDEMGVCKQDRVNEYDNSSFFIKMDLNDTKARFSIKKYAKSLEPVFISEPKNRDAKDVLSFSVSNGIDAAPLELFRAESVEIDGVLFKFDKDDDCAQLPQKSVCFGFENSKAFMRSSLEITALNSTATPKNTKTSLKIGELYRLPGLTFAPKQALRNAIKSYRQTQNGGEKDGFLLQIQTLQSTKNTWVVPDEIAQIYIGDKEFKLSAFKQNLSLPFSVRLDDFRLARYPGSNSPSGYFSKLTLTQNGITTNAIISPNSPLDYAGFRLFQTSYDTDELGSLLSVSFDPGRRLTYAGYGLLCLGFLLNLFNKNSRFFSLLKK